MDKSTIKQLFGSSFYAEKLIELVTIYEEIDKKINAFFPYAPAFCSASCGICCENFIPSITEVESDLIAAWFFYIQKPPFLDIVKKTTKSCPFYDPSNNAHCTIYPVRPLVCRLYGYSSHSTKTGIEMYKTCKHSVQKNDNQHIDVCEVLQMLVQPPSFSEYGHLPMEISRQSFNQINLIHETLEIDIQKAAYYKMLNEMNNDPDKPQNPISPSSRPA